MEGIESQRLKKLVAKEDRISALPDFLIHHILSFLPSTKQAIQTGVLSKRWLKQWTCVPVLVFDSRATPFKNICRCVDNTLILHNCSKIKKFHVKFGSIPETDSQLTAQVRFITLKCVEELILDMEGSMGKYRLPNFLFSYSSLVILKTTFCRFVPNGTVAWGFLKELKLYLCELTDESMKKVLSGSPSLESLKIRTCEGLNQFVVASKSLKTLDLCRTQPSIIEISCSNLVDLTLCVSHKALKSANVPSLTCASLLICSQHLTYNGEDIEEYRSMVKIFLGWIEQLKKLTLRFEFITVLSTLTADASSSLFFNCRWLTLYASCYKDPAGLAYVLRNFPVLDTLILQWFGSHHSSKLDAIEENWWSSNETVFNCLESHLKTVKIIGLSRSNCMCKLVLDFMVFILKNARVLEKMVVVLKDKNTNFVVEVSNKLLNIPRCSQQAIVQVNCK